MGSRRIGHGGLVITTPPLDNGINREIAERLRQRRVYAPLQKPGAEMIALKMHAIDPEVVKHELVQMLREVGVELLLHTLIVGSVVEQGAVKGCPHREQGRAAKPSWQHDSGRHGDADVGGIFRAAVPSCQKTDHDDVQTWRASTSDGSSAGWATGATSRRWSRRRWHRASCSSSWHHAGMGDPGVHANA